MWDEAIQREDRELSTKDAVCEKHFDPKCIVKEWQRGDSLVHFVLYLFIHYLHLYFITNRFLLSTLD